MDQGNSAGGGATTDDGNSKYRSVFDSQSTVSTVKGLWQNSLVRWLLLVVVLLLVFIAMSSYQYPSVLPVTISAAEIPELDFNLANLVSAAIGLSQLASAAIIDVKTKHAEKIKIKGKTAEGVDEPVTLADSTSNQIIVNGFRTLFSHSRAVGNEDGHAKIDLMLISEEEPPSFSEVVPPLEFVEIGPGNSLGDALLDPSRVSIIIDPLDATLEFTQEVDADGSDMLPFVTTLICIVQDGRPLAGVVDRPFVDSEPVMWASVAEMKLHGVQPLSSDSTGHTDLITVSRSHAGDAKDIVSSNFEGKKSLPAGGAGYKSWLVLTGKADAYVHVTAIKAWDVCAGHALLLAAGGDMTDKAGQPLEY